MIVNGFCKEVFREPADGVRGRGAEAFGSKSGGERGVTTWLNAFMKFGKRSMMMDRSFIRVFSLILPAPTLENCSVPMRENRPLFEQPAILRR